MLKIDTLDGQRLLAERLGNATEVRLMDPKGSVVGHVPVADLLTAGRFLDVTAEGTVLTLGPVVLAQLKQL
jgi:hypothetical protein